MGGAEREGFSLLGMEVEGKRQVGGSSGWPIKWS